MMRQVSFLFLASIFFLMPYPYAGGATKLKKEQIVPGAQILLNVPELGMAGRNKTKPVQIFIGLPKNLNKDIKHPVIVHLGGGYGNPAGVKRYQTITQQKDFIYIGVDYTFEKRYKGTRDIDFKNSVYALKMLAKVLKYDKKSIWLSGLSSGAYCISSFIHSKNASLFCGFIQVIGGMPISASHLKKRPLLLIAGERDTQKASAGRSRVGVQQESYKKLKKSRRDVTLILQKGVGHAWGAKNDPEVLDWLYLKTPSLKKASKAYEKLKKTRSDSSKKRYLKTILATPFEPPYLQECKALMEKLEAEQ